MQSNEESKIADIVAKILEYRTAWHEITGGSVEGEVAAIGDPQEVVTDETVLQKFMPALYRGSAINLWKELTDLLVGWALTAEVQFREALEATSPPEVTPLNEDRQRLNYEFLKARFVDPELRKEYSIVVLDSDLVWRAGEALTKLSFGELTEMFQPAPRRSFKDGYTLPIIREELLACCHFLHGGGMSMQRAMDTVSELAGVTDAAIRNWSRSLKKGHSAENPIFYEAFLAGAHHAGSSFSDAVARLTFRPAEFVLRDIWKDLEAGRPQFFDLGKAAEIGAKYKTAVVELSRSSKRKLRGKR